MSYSLFPHEEPQFNHGVVRPFVCFGNGWQLIKDQYFLYVGLCAVIVVAVTCIPFTGLLWGAWITGIYSAMLGRMRGELATFGGAVSRGFGVFGPTVVVAILANLPFIPFGVGIKLFSDWIDRTDTVYSGEQVTPDDVLVLQLEAFAGLIALYIAAFFISGFIFPFAYQLVVDRKMKGWAAVKLSARASRANFSGVLGLLWIELALGAAGVLACCLGVVFVIPLTKSAWAIAYRDVFPPPPDSQPAIAPPPPPPPVFSTV